MPGAGHAGACTTGPPPVSLLDRLRADLQAVGTRIRTQIKEAQAAANRAGRAEADLPSVPSIQRRFEEPVWAFASAWLRAARPDPATHDRAAARRALEESAGQILRCCFPPQPVAPTPTAPVKQSRAARNRRRLVGGAMVVQVRGDFTLTPADRKVLRILFGRREAKDILYVLDEPETLPRAEPEDADPGIVEPLLPEDFRHVLRINPRSVEKRLRGVLNQEIGASLLTYPEILTTSTGVEGSAPSMDLLPPELQQAKKLIDRARQSTDPREAIDNVLRTLGWNRNQWADKADVDRVSISRWFFQGKNIDPGGEYKLIATLAKHIAEVKARPTR